MPMARRQGHQAHLKEGGAAITPFCFINNLIAGG